MARSIMPGAIAATLLAGCATHVPHPSPVVALHSLPAPDPADAWKDYASPADQAVVAALPQRFAAARAAVPARFAARLKAEGPLLDPAVAEPMPQMPPGTYRCRMVRLGGRDALRSFAPDFCYVGAAEDRVAFTKQTGSILPEGYVYPHGRATQVFLGTMRVAGTPGGQAYGSDVARDVVGLVDRVAPFRWRMLLSRAGRGAAIDLYELVPVTPDVPGASTATAATPRPTPGRKG